MRSGVVPVRRPGRRVELRAGVLRVVGDPRRSRCGAAGRVRAAGMVVVLTGAAPVRYSMGMSETTIETAIRSVYPKISATKLAELVAALGPFLVQPVREVAVEGATGAVDRVEAYGLELETDALGRAVTVYFPLSAEVTKWV